MKAVWIVSVTLGIFAGVSASAQNTVSQWNWAGVDAQQEATTQEVLFRIQEAVENNCMPLSADADEISIVQQIIHRSNIVGGRYKTIAKNSKCDSDLPCSTSVQKYVGGGMLLQESTISMLRTGIQDGKLRSYSIHANVKWDMDLPLPMVDLELNSDYCRAR